MFVELQLNKITLKELSLSFLGAYLQHFIFFVTYEWAQ